MNALVNEAIKFLAEKNGTSEKYICECILSGQHNYLVSQIKSLVDETLPVIWEHYNK